MSRQIGDKNKIKIVIPEKIEETRTSSLYQIMSQLRTEIELKEKEINELKKQNHWLKSMLSKTPQININQ